MTKKNKIGGWKLWHHLKDGKRYRIVTMLFNNVEAGKREEKGLIFT